MRSAAHADFEEGMKNKPALLFLVLFLAASAGLVWRVSNATDPVARVQPNFGQLLTTRGAEPAGDLGGRLDPGTVLDRRSGGFVIHALREEAFVDPSALAPVGPTAVLAAAECQDRLLVEGEVDMDLLGALGLEAARARLQSSGVAVVQTRVENLTRTEITSFQIENARLQGSVLDHLGHSPAVQLVQVVFRADDVRMRYLTERGHDATASVGVEGLGLGGEYREDASSEGWIHYGPRVVGYRPALLVDPRGEMTGEARGLYRRRLADSGLEYEAEGGTVVVSGRPEELRLAAGLAELVLAEQDVAAAQTALTVQQGRTAEQLEARVAAERQLEDVEERFEALRIEAAGARDRLQELPDLREENERLRRSMKEVLESDLLEGALKRARTELEVPEDARRWRPALDARRVELQRRGRLDVAERKLEELEAVEQARRLIDG